MAATLKVVDRYTGASAAQRGASMRLRLASERVTAREIIRSRVEAEVHEINETSKQLAEELRAEPEAPAQSGTIGAEAERRLNVRASKSWAWAKSVDVEAECERAMTAFARRQFIMLLDDRQIDDLDEAVGLRPESEVVFVHLTPLKGG